MPAAAAAAGSGTTTSFPTAAGGTAGQGRAAVMHGKRKGQAATAFASPEPSSASGKIISGTVATSSIVTPPMSLAPGAVGGSAAQGQGGAPSSYAAIAAQGVPLPAPVPTVSELDEEEEEEDAGEEGEENGAPSTSAFVSRATDAPELDVAFSVVSAKAKARHGKGKAAAARNVPEQGMGKKRRVDDGGKEAPVAQAKGSAVAAGRTSVPLPAQALAPAPWAAASTMRKSLSAPSPIAPAVAAPVVQTPSAPSVPAPAPAPAAFSADQLAAPPTSAWGTAAKLAKAASAPPTAAAGEASAQSSPPVKVPASWAGLFGSGSAVGSFGSGSPAPPAPVPTTAAVSGQGEGAGSDHGDPEGSVGKEPVEELTEAKLQKVRSMRCDGCRRTPLMQPWGLLLMTHSQPHTHTLAAHRTDQPGQEHTRVCCLHCCYPA